jgi:formylglycine-generating enzyme required for sulfatase activity
MTLGKLVIPVLINRTEMPRAAELPDSMKLFARRQAVWITTQRLRADAQGLVQKIGRVLSEFERQENEEAEVRQRAEQDERRRNAEAGTLWLAADEPAAAALRRTADNPRKNESNAAPPEYVSGANYQEHQPPKAWRPSRRQLMAGCLLGAILVGAVGVWFGNPRPASVAPEAPPTPAPMPRESIPVQSPPPIKLGACQTCAIVDSSASPVRPASGSVGPLSPEHERALKPKDTFKECDNCPEMVVVPQGSFTMGSPDSEKGHSPRESPQHPVTFARQFAVGRFAVTFDEWDACVADGGCGAYRPPDQGWGRAGQPVINVNWDEAKSYVAWLSTKTGGPYRLLSEAEFEYATRAGSKAAYPWGDKIGINRADCRGCGSQWDGKQTAPVGSFPANAFGLYDMAGNIWDWVEDCYWFYQGAPSDGAAVTPKDCSFRVMRGGSWSSGPEFVRSAYRNSVIPNVRAAGFRVARTLSPPVFP